MAAIRAAHPGGAVVENAAVEVAMDRLLHAVTQVSVGPLKSLVVDEKEALEVMGEGPIEDRALRMPRGR